MPFPVVDVEAPEAACEEVEDYATNVIPQPGLKCVWKRSPEVVRKQIPQHDFVVEARFLGKAEEVIIFHYSGSDSGRCGRTVAGEDRTAENAAGGENETEEGGMRIAAAALVSLPYVRMMAHVHLHRSRRRKRGRCK
ncbi:hypothetical protein ACLOJK_001280 [Asimina triloba]